MKHQIPARHEYLHQLKTVRESKLKFLDEMMKYEKLQNIFPDQIIKIKQLITKTPVLHSRFFPLNP